MTKQDLMDFLKPIIEQAASAIANFHGTRRERIMLAGELGADLLETVSSYIDIQEQSVQSPAAVEL